MPNQTLDAVKTATVIHDGDYSSLRGKSFVIRDNMENKGRRGKSVKKPKKNKYTLNQLGSKVDQLGTTVDKLTMTVSDLAKTVSVLAKTVSDGFARIDARIDRIEKRLDYNGLKELPTSNKQ